MRRSLPLIMGGLLVVCAHQVLADPADINVRIRKEEAEHSQILRTVH